MELEFGPNMKVVGRRLSFPTTPGMRDLELYNSSYASISEERSVRAVLCAFRTHLRCE